MAKTFASVSMLVQGSRAAVPSSTPFFNPGQQTSTSGGEASFGPPMTLASDPGDLISSIDVASITVPSTTQMEQSALLPSGSSHSSSQNAVSVYCMGPLEPVCKPMTCYGEKFFSLL